MLGIARGCWQASKKSLRVNYAAEEPSSFLALFIDTDYKGDEFYACSSVLPLRCLLRYDNCRDPNIVLDAEHGAHASMHIKRRFIKPRRWWFDDT
jgi:hypothetical protein